MNDIKIWCTYHKLSQLNNYNLYDTDLIKLFYTNNLDLKDENINKFNTYLSEIVTYYYVWKNQIKSDYIGFCHYRRHFGKINFDLLNNGYTQCYSRYIVNNNYKNQITNFCKSYFKVNPLFPEIFKKYLLEKYNKDIDNIYPNEYYISNRISFIFNWENFNKFCEIFFGFLDYICKERGIRDWKNQIYPLNNFIIMGNTFSRSISVILELIASIIVEIFFNPFYCGSNKCIVIQYDDIYKLIQVNNLLRKTGSYIINISNKLNLNYYQDKFLYNNGLHHNEVISRTSLDENLPFDINTKEIIRLNENEYIDCKDFRDLENNTYIIKKIET